MYSGKTQTIAVLAALLTLVISAACGGGDGGGDSPFDIGSNPTEPSNGSGDSGSGGGGSDTSPSAGGSGEDPWLSAEEGEAWTEVEGERLVYQLLETDHYLCSIRDEQIQVSFQSNEGHSFSVNGGFQGGTWFGHFTAHVGGGGPDLQYQGELSGGDVRFGVNETSLSWEGTVSRVEDRDLLNAEDMPASMAVNCDSGIAVEAALDGEAIEFDLSGLSLPECEISEQDFQIEINNPIGQDDLEAEARLEDGSWVGHVVVRRGEDSYISTIPQDGEGLDPGEGSLAYAGSFELRSAGRATGDFVEGSASVTCP